MTNRTPYEIAELIHKCAGGYGSSVGSAQFLHEIELIISDAFPSPSWIEVGTALPESDGDYEVCNARTGGREWVYFRTRTQMFTMSKIANSMITHWRVAYPLPLSQPARIES